jgi:hypothetical protein
VKKVFIPAGNKYQHEINILSSVKCVKIYLDVINYLLTTNFTELNPSSEAAVVQLLKKFLIFYGARRFISVVTTALHCSLF